jgi:hypothetical protein
VVLECVNDRHDRLRATVIVGALLLVTVSCTQSRSNEQPSPAVPFTAGCIPSNCSTAEDTELHLVSFERDWVPPSSSTVRPTPSPGSHFGRATVRFVVLAGSQYVGGDQLSLLTTSPIGAAQQFGSGAGLSIPIPSDCRHPDVTLISAGHTSDEIAVCWQFVGPVDQQLTLSWLSDHGQTAGIKL